MQQKEGGMLAAEAKHICRLRCSYWTAGGGDCSNSQLCTNVLWLDLGKVSPILERYATTRLLRTPSIHSPLTS
jgi:hypothetical protein